VVSKRTLSRHAEEIARKAVKPHSIWAFNNAGIEGEVRSLVEQTEANYDAVMDINVKRVWLSMKYEIPLVGVNGPEPSEFQRRSYWRQLARLGVLAMIRVFDGSLLYIRRHWQVWIGTFCISGRGFDSTPGRTNSLLDFLFTGGQRIVRDVQRAVLYLGFDHAVQSYDRVG